MSIENFGRCIVFYVLLIFEFICYYYLSLFLIASFQFIWKSKTCSVFSNRSILLQLINKKSVFSMQIHSRYYFSFTILNNTYRKIDNLSPT